MVEEFVISRDDWVRGRQSSLLNPDGKMCCLGFFSLACGLTEDDILYRGTPADVMEDSNFKFTEILTSEAPWLVEVHDFGDDEPMICNGKDTNYLMEINDDSNTDDKCKEEEIIRIFAENGVKVTFVE